MHKMVYPILVVNFLRLLINLKKFHRTETRYLTEHYPVTQQQACPTGQEICCQNYFFILDHCFRKYFFKTITSTTKHFIKT